MERPRAMVYSIREAPMGVCGVCVCVCVCVCVLGEGAGRGGGAHTCAHVIESSAPRRAQAAPAFIGSPAN